MTVMLFHENSYYARPTRVGSTLARVSILMAAFVFIIMAVLTSTGRVPAKNVFEAFEGHETLIEKAKEHAEAAKKAAEEAGKHLDTHVAAAKIAAEEAKEVVEAAVETGKQAAGEAGKAMGEASMKVVQETMKLMSELVEVGYEVTGMSMGIALPPSLDVTMTRNKFFDGAALRDRASEDGLTIPHAALLNVLANIADMDEGLTAAKVAVKHVTVSFPSMSVHVGMSPH